MTSQNQQPQGPSPFDRPPGHPSTNNSSWTTTQPIHTNSILQQQSPLPEQKGPGWVYTITPYARSRVPTNCLGCTVDFFSSIINP